MPTNRAELIPITHNFPGFPLGVSGAELLTRLRKQAERYTVQLTELIRFLLPRAITTFPQRSMPSS